MDGLFALGITVGDTPGEKMCDWITHLPESNPYPELQMLVVCHATRLSRSRAFILERIKFDWEFDCAVEWADIDRKTYSRHVCWIPLKSRHA